MRKVWILLVLLPLAVHGEHVFEAGVRLGAAAWNAQTTYVSAQPGMHAGLEVAYAYHSPYVVGFRVGLSLDRHQAGFGRRNYEDTYLTIDKESQRMQVDYTIGSLSEQYTFWSAGIPLQLALAWQGVSLSVGPKAVFPLSSRWHERAEEAALSVYYPDYDNRVYESFPLAASRHFEEHGNGTFPVRSVQWWLASELSYTHTFRSSSSAGTFSSLYHGRSMWLSALTVGVYFDYSFSPVSPEASDRQSLIMLTDTRDGLPLQRILTPVHTANRQGEQLVRKAALFDIGIKIAYSFSPYDTQRRNRDNCHCR